MSSAHLGLLTAAVVLALLLGVTGLIYGPTVYRDWHQRLLLRRAASMLQDGKFDDAIWAAREVVKLNSNSLPAYYVLAEAAEKENLQESIQWRAQIARLLPRDSDSQLNLASAALRFGEIDLARRALEHVSGADRDRAAFHVVAGWLARAQGNLAEQEQQFAAAVSKEPGNDLYQFNLAVLRIHSPDSEKNAKARTALDRLSKVASFRVAVLRALLNDAVARNHLAAADNFAEQLQMSQQVTFGDYLLCLNFYRKLDDKKFAMLLDKVKPFAARNASDLASLMSWMNENGLAAEAAKWIDQLPPAKIALPPVAIAVADAFANVKNWSRLKRWTRGGSWREADYLRLAYQAIATRRSQQSNDLEFQTLWRSAEETAGKQPEHQLALARLATKWNLTAESERLWLRVAQNPPMRREAFDALRRLYRKTNSLQQLYDVLQRLHASSPDEAPVTADLARLGFNLEQNTAQSQELAKEAYDRAPTETNCAVTYAFSLYRAGQSLEALKVIQNLPAEHLHDPHAAVYVALLLAGADQLEPAKDYIAAVDEAKIYVEEKKLLDEAKTKLAAAARTSSPPISPSPAVLSSTPTTPPH